MVIPTGAVMGTDKNAPEVAGEEITDKVKGEWGGGALWSYRRRQGATV